MMIQLVILHLPLLDQTGIKSSLRFDREMHWISHRRLRNIEVGPLNFVSTSVRILKNALMLV